MSKFKLKFKLICLIFILDAVRKELNKCVKQEPGSDEELDDDKFNAIWVLKIKMKLNAGICAPKH